MAFDRESSRIAAGVMTAQEGHSFARLHEIWLRTHEGKLTRDVVEDLKGEVDRLKCELKGRRLRVAP